MRQEGSIPACAGEPQPCGRCPFCGSKGLSPRVRGNRRVAWPEIDRPGQKGLSPRVRGNPRLGRHISNSYRHGRSIPACAGEPIVVIRATKVYPRVCGGTNTALKAVSNWVYPRVCGGTTLALEAPRARFHIRKGRSIPACAGEPRTFGNRDRLHAASPGLSPRVRGNPIFPLHYSAFSARSIPACAGEPSSVQIRQALLGSIPACAGEPGSWWRLCTSEDGSIPACAGEPLR